MPALTTPRRRPGRRLVCLVIGWAWAACAGLHGSLARADDEPAPEAAPAEAANPLGEALRGLLDGQPPAPPAPRVRNGEGNDGESATQRRQFDPSLNSDVRSSQALLEMEGFIQREKWPEVVAALQSLIEGAIDEGDTFGRARTSDWTSAQRLAEARLRTLPPAGRELYARVYSQTAADLLDQARRSGDVQQLAQIARRFLNVPAGRQAAIDLAISHFDRDEHLAAVRWFERALSAHSSLPPDVQLKYAWSLRRVGRQAESDAALEQSLAGRPALQPVAEALRRIDRPAATAVPTLSQWPMFLGTPSRLAAAPPESPLPLEQWRLPLTHVPVVRRQIEDLLTDLHDAGRACLPTTFPLIVRGRLALRTWRGVEVFDLETGRPLWCGPLERASPDRLLSGTLDGSGETRAEQQRLISPLQYVDNGDYDQHPLTGLLFRDSVSGQLTSDGRQLFLLAEQAVLGQSVQRGWWTQEQPDPFDRDWTSNRISAFDLETGAVQWMVGGPRFEEPFDLPLAGTYFFGPPTPADNELYVIGERDSEICLFVLDAQLGRPVYVQPLANASARVDVDIVRRQWGCLPAIAEGIVVCPTTCGWLVAVDRREQRLLWAAQVAAAPGEPRQQFDGAAVQRLEPLNTRWAMTPPIIAGGRVLYTPLELPDLARGREPFLICLDLATGREQWRTAKQEEGLYLAAATAQAAVVVGRGRVRALALSDGRELWSTTLPVDARPSGRGVVSGGELWLPLSNRQLWSIALADGRPTSTLQLPPHVAPLGNLVCGEGQLVSVDSLEVRCFRRHAALQAEIAARQARDPDDLWALVRQAELDQLQGRFAAAADGLLRGESVTQNPQADPELQQQWRDLLRELLVALVAADFRAGEQYHTHLERLFDPLTDPDVLRLSVARGIARGEYADVWRQLWPPPTDEAAAVMLTDGPLRIRRDAWTAGQLQNLYNAASDQLRGEMDAAITAAVEAVLQADSSSGTAGRLERLLGFHPAGRRLTMHLAIQAESAGTFADAELRWRSLLDVDDPAVAARGGLRLVRWLASRELREDAAALLPQVQERLAAAPQALREELETAWKDLQQTVAAAAQSPARTSGYPDWTDTEFEVVPVARRGREEQIQDVTLFPAREPFYQRHRFEFLPPTQRLRMLAGDDRTVWSLPLQMPQRQPYDQTVGVRTDGLQAYAVWQGVVHALSLPDRQVRWTHPIEFRSSGGNYVRNARSETDLTLQPADRFAAQWGLRRFRSPTGMLAAAAPTSLLLHGRRELSRLDPLTGAVQWTRGGLPAQTMVYGDADAVYVLPVDHSPPLALRAVDGVEIDRPVLAELADRAVAIRHGRLFVFEVRAALFGLLGSRLELRSVDVATGQQAWVHRIDRQTLVGWLSPGELLFLAPDGEVSTLSIDDGAATVLGKLPADALTHRDAVQMIADHRQVFLLVNRPQQRYINYLSDPWARADGTVVCFHRRGEGLLWSRTLSEFQLLLAQFDQSPVLVLVQQTNQEPSFALRVELWDKRTGRKLVEADDLMSPAALYQATLDLGDRRVQLLTHNLAIEVRPRRPAPSPPVAPAPASPPAAPAVP